MKLKSSASVAALMVAISAGPALAACPPGTTEGWVDDGGVAVPGCGVAPALVVPGAIVSGVSSPNGSTELDASGVPHQLLTSSLTTFAYGQNNLAAGNNSFVGKTSSYDATSTTVVDPNTGTLTTSLSCPNGGILNVSTHACATTGPVTDGTAVGARANVQHDHSTALGADATTTADHQVMLGTSSDTVVMPGNADVKGALTVNGANVGDALTDHGGRIVTLETAQGALQATVDAHGLVLDDHGVKIGQLQTDVNGLVTVTNDHGVRIGTLETTVADHGAQIGALQSTTQSVSGDANGVTVHGQATVTGPLHVTGASVFDNAVTINTGGHTTTVDGSGATFANATGSTKVDGGNVTSTGTTKTGSLSVDHDANVGGNVNVTGYVNSSTAYVGTFSGNAMTGGATEIGNALTSYGAALADHSGRLDALEGWQATAKGQISDLYNRSSKAYEGTAIALAAQNFTLEAGKRFGVSANFGTFEGQSALASSVAIRLDTNWQLNGSVGFGTNNGTVGARAGVIGQW